MAYELTTDFYYPLAEIYEGDAQKVQFTFSAPPVGTEWYASQMIDSFEEETAKQGESILRLRVYEDHKPISETKFFVEFVITASPLGPVAIAGIITACLLALGVMTYFILRIVSEHWPEVAMTAKWIGVAIASGAVIAIVGALTKALPKRREK